MFYPREQARLVSVFDPRDRIIYGLSSGPLLPGVKKKWLTLDYNYSTNYYMFSLSGSREPPTRQHIIHNSFIVKIFQGISWIEDPNSFNYFRSFSYPGKLCCCRIYSLYLGFGPRSPCNFELSLSSPLTHNTPLPGMAIILSQGIDMRAAASISNGIWDFSYKWFFYFLICFKA